MGDIEIEGFCLVCSSDVDEWAPGPAGRPRASCPNCGSLERHRFLALTLKGFRPTLTAPTRVLEAAPKAGLERVVRSLAPNIQHVRTDLFEHIPDDRGAMREVARVLGSGGLMICQVPQREGKPTDEDFTLSPEQNEARFGQADHVRWYGSDFDDRLRQSGFTVVNHAAGDVFDTLDLKRFNIPANDRLWLCRKAAASWPDPGPNRKVARLQSELSAAHSRYERLRSRKVVRAGLALARLARPIFSATRRVRGGAPPADSPPSDTSQTEPR